MARKATDGSDAGVHKCEGRCFLLGMLDDDGVVVLVRSQDRKHEAAKKDKGGRVGRTEVDDSAALHRLSSPCVVHME